MKATTAWGANHGLLNGAIAAIVVLAAGALGGRLPGGAVLLAAVATASAALGALFLYRRRSGRPPGHRGGLSDFVDMHPGWSSYSVCC